MQFFIYLFVAFQTCCIFTCLLDLSRVLFKLIQICIFFEYIITNILEQPLKQQQRPRRRRKKTTQQISNDTKSYKRQKKLQNIS